MITIYALVCPEKEQIRYIGKTNRPLNIRLNGHLQEAKKVTSHKQRWIAKLAAKGLRPGIASLEEVPEGVRWQDRERYWIAWAYEMGLPLTNQTAGGEGLDFIDPELKARYALKQSGIAKRNLAINPDLMQPARDGTKALWAKDRAARIAGIMAGWTPEAKARWAESMAAAWQTPEFRQAHSKGIKAAWVKHREIFMAAFAKPETKARQSAAKQRAWKDPEKRARLMNRWTPEARERQREVIKERQSRIAVAMTPEVRAKQAESLRCNWAMRKEMKS